MTRHFFSLVRVLPLCLCLCLFGCAQPPQHQPVPSGKPLTTAFGKRHTGVSRTPAPAPAPAPSVSGKTTLGIDPTLVANSKRNRAGCFHLQPARTVLITTTAHHRSKGKKARESVPKKGKKSFQSHRTKTQKTISRTVGLCQPQSLTYARCRTGIDTCRLGNTSPVQWFGCARANKATSTVPVAGSVIVIDTHPERRMHTGHPAYVEEARRNGDGSWSLRISHTNYDRKCHLDLDAMVRFFPRTMTASFETGPWSPWAKHLKVLGFILR